MVQDIYFVTKAGKLMTDSDVVKAAIINGDYIDGNNLDDVRKYASTCKGIVKEVNPSIKVCLKNGDKITAIRLYYHRHPGISLKETRDAVEKMMEKMGIPN